MPKPKNTSQKTKIDDGIAWDAAITDAAVKTVIPVCIPA